MVLDGGANKAERRGTPGAIRRYAVKRSSARLRRAGGEREEVPQADLVTNAEMPERQQSRPV